MYKKRKSINFTDPEAITLIHERAKKENRSLANATVTTIIEALGKTNVSQIDGHKKNIVKQ